MPAYLSTRLFPHTHAHFDFLSDPKYLFTKLFRNLTWVLLSATEVIPACSHPSKIASSQNPEQSELEKPT